MNIFSLRRRKAVPHSDDAKKLELLVHSDRYAKLRHQYAMYCTSLLMPYERAAEQFTELCSRPYVVYVGFDSTSQSFLIGTPLITLTDETTGNEHEIGEFIISMDRVEKQIRFENITRSIPSKGGQILTYHPHVTCEGSICMPTSGTRMMTALQEGNILMATDIAIAGLYTYTPLGNPYSRLNAWPRRK